MATSKRKYDKTKHKSLHKQQREAEQARQQRITEKRADFTRLTRRSDLNKPALKLVPQTDKPVCAKQAEYQRRRKLLPPMNFDDFCFACQKLKRELGI